MVVSFGEEVFLGKLGGIEQIQNCFIINDVKIKGNTPYLILILEVELPPSIESKAMIRYLMYKNKLINMKKERFSITTSNIIKTHSKLKARKARDVAPWLNNWGIVEEVSLQDINIIKT
jgi:hypothetical protein